jgi:hypothetical protein
MVIFGAGFVTDDAEGLEDSLFVESSGQSDSLGENGGLSGASNTV